ncbi:MAG: hypothetical protein ACTHNW_00095 [Mucilaginibacter sp.]
MRVTIRKRPLVKGRHRLVLNFYPPVFSPITNKSTRYENLKLFLYDHPVTADERNHNKKTIELSNSICASRQLDIQTQMHRLVPNFRKQESFIAYFRKLTDQQRGINWHNWDSSVRYFQLLISLSQILIYPFAKVLSFPYGLLDH